ncbi:MAG TPA: NDP-sugar synthase [Myxococcota bacterium]|nr:NDP-sugar synthase [Myxococcota bacterium]HQK50870.1 NDP-sugar synthase [Myxococcota bacterium]
MKAMVLAAGLGERLRPFTDRLPKPLFPVLGIPLIRLVLCRLRQTGVNEAVINLHHLPGAIVRELGSGRDLGMRLEYSDEPILLGTGGGVRAVADFFQGEEAFWLHNGDILADWDLESVWRMHHDRQAVATLALDEGEERPEARMVEIDAMDRVVGIRGRPRRGDGTRVVFTGVSVLTPHVLQTLPQGEVSCLVNQGLIPLLERDRLVLGARVHGTFVDIGTPERLVDAQWRMLPRARAWFGSLGLPLPQEVAPGVFLHGDSDVHPEARLEGPLWVSPGCRIEAGVIVGPRVVLGTGTVVRAPARVREALVIGGEVGGDVSGIYLPGASPAASGMGPTGTPSDR